MEESMAKNMGFGMANMVQRYEQQQLELNEAIEHLANAVICNKTVVANLVQENKMQAQQVKSMQEQIDKLMEKLSGGDNKTRGKDPLYGHKTREAYYCWTYGITVTRKYQSKSWNNPTEGHKKILHQQT
eukprot:12223798-Ditylum_brightwellii.AAC.1